MMMTMMMMMCDDLGEAPPRPIRIVRGRLVIGALEIWIRRASAMMMMMMMSVRGGGLGGGGNPMHRTHLILMRAIGWVAVKIFLTSGVPAGAGSYC